MWTNDTGKNWCLDKNGKLVEEGDPAAVVLLVAAGSQIPIADAEKYGLVKKQGAATSGAENEAAEKAKEPPANKAKK